MSLLRNVERVQQIHRMIKFKRTGTPEEFAGKLGLSVSTMYGIIKELKTLGAPIGYCRFRRSFLYTQPVEFTIGFVGPTRLEHTELAAVSGGADLSIVSIRAGCGGAA